jgi:hypothetical protein
MGDIFTDHGVPSTRYCDSCPSTVEGLHTKGCPTKETKRIEDRLKTKPGPHPMAIANHYADKILLALAPHQSTFGQNNPQAWIELCKYHDDITEDIYQAIRAMLLTDKRWNEIEVE